MASDTDIQSLPATSGNECPPSLMTLPPEIRLEILRYCLRTEGNRFATWRVNHMSSEDFWSTSEHLPAAADMPVTMSAPEDISYQLHPAILTVCTILLNEGRTVLYAENRWVAIEETVDSPFDLKLKLPGFNPSWCLSSPIYKTRLEAPESLMQSGGDAASLEPWLSFDLAKDGGGDRVTQLVPLLEVDLVIQAICILQSIHGGWKGKPASSLTIHNEVAFLDKGASTLLIRRILPWLSDRVFEVCFHDTRYSKSLQHLREGSTICISSETASAIVKELSTFSTMDTTIY